jgi:hypothetical protein
MGCLEKANPRFGRIPISYLALPGSENAGTYNLDPFGAVNQPGSACTTLSPALPVTGVKAQRFSSTQDQSIVQQLDDGVRWIDLRIGYNGNGNPLSGWRVAQNLYSSYPLLEYLDQVANWAGQHPNEVVFVDLSSICYDHHPTDVIDRGLWANFATKSPQGAGPLTLADVAVTPSRTQSLAAATLSQLHRASRNVVVLVPADAKDSDVLAKRYHVDAVHTTPVADGGAATQVYRSDPRIAPTSPTGFSSANSQLASVSANSPQLGSLRGRGLYVSKLAYELKGASATSQGQVLSNFVGLVANQGIFRAWMSGLWSGEYPQILSTWGTATNVVIANGVDHGGFVNAVIALNGR